jgi:hypothetical protein
MTESTEAEALEPEGDVFQWCDQPEIPPVDVSGISDPDRAHAIVRSSAKWISGTTIRYYLYREIEPEWGVHPNARWIGDEVQYDAVREAFDKWKAQGIGLDFEEVDDASEAEVRIGFVRGGSWSYVGTGVLNISNPRRRTMNFGWDLTTDHGKDTVLHEIGHTLGMPHEHQNPNAGIVWDEQAVLAYFRGPPNNWSEDQTRHNVLRKLSSGAVHGSTWDRNSIMHYGFRRGLIQEPEELRGGLDPQAGLSTQDVAWIQAWYPPVEDDDIKLLKPLVSHPISILSGQQAHFIIEPDATRAYAMMTIGSADTLLVLFEDTPDGWRHLDSDDDSGESRNARIEAKLFAGRRYALRTRLYHSTRAAEFGVLLV